MDNRWEVRKNEIVWKVGSGDHIDNIEMSGRKLAAVLYYGVGSGGTVRLTKRLFYPTLRTIPNDTHATLMHEYGQEDFLKFGIMGREIAEIPYEIRFNGILMIHSRDREEKIRISRMLYPSPEKMAFVEHITVQNLTDDTQVISCGTCESVIYERGTKGVYVLETETRGPRSVTLKSGRSVAYDTIYTGRKLCDEKPEVNGIQELTARRDFVNSVFNDSLVLTTDDPVLNCEFSFAKLRITESILDTDGGPMHNPGGQSYYAAIWANDEAEYAAPYFGFAGNKLAYEATENVMKLYRPFMHPQLYHIPASIISEGTDIWEGRGDLGDASMYLYGMTRFLLERGDTRLAEEYFDTIDWCVRFAASKENEFGVIESDSDELEGRLPSGKANLLNNCLTYGGLNGAYYMAAGLGYSDKAREYKDFAKRLRKGIEDFFGAEVSGYRTYQYYDGCNVLRAYTCAPLTVGIYDRREGTVNGLIEKLWTENGFLSSEDDSMFWDRSTLYALRGIFSAGMGDKGYKYLKEYNQKRLLGDHVPYPIEAWPEGDQRHLSAEGGLYARVIIEGMLGVSPTGFRSFSIAPSIPAGLGKVTLEKIRAFGSCFDISADRTGRGYEVKITNADGCEQVHVIPLDGSAEIVI